MGQKHCIAAIEGQVVDRSLRYQLLQRGVLRVQDRPARSDLHVLGDGPNLQFGIDLQARLDRDLYMRLGGGLEALLFRGQCVGAQFERAENKAAVRPRLRGFFATRGLFGYGHSGIRNVRTGGILHCAYDRPGIDLRVQRSWSEGKRQSE